MTGGAGACGYQQEIREVLMSSIRLLMNSNVWRDSPVAQVEFRGKLRPVGPSSVAVGDGVVYVGSRADSKICAIDSRSLKLDNCFEFAPPSAGMAAAPDALIYILATREVGPPLGHPRWASQPPTVPCRSSLLHNQ